VSETTDRRARFLREAVAPYESSDAAAGHTKLSISLPTELVEAVRATATETGASVSAVIASAIRASIEAAEQADLDAAIEAQNEENLEWANAYLPIAAKLWSEIEW
jgi:predicted DNA-binding protein